MSRELVEEKKLDGWKCKAAGAEAIFPPGTVIAEAAEDLIAKLNKRLGYGQKAAE